MNLPSRPSSDPGSSLMRSLSSMSFTSAARRCLVPVLACAAGLPAVELSDFSVRAGVVPRLDGVRTNFNYNSYNYQEYDRTFDYPTGYGLGVQLDYLAGEVDGAGWVYGVGFEHSQRSFRITYDTGTASPWMGMQGYAFQAVGGLGFGGPSAILTLTPFVGAGYVSVDHYAVDMGNGERQVRPDHGFLLMGGFRMTASLMLDEAWMLTAAGEWQMGSAWSTHEDHGPVGDMTDNTRYDWRGFAGGVGLGYRF